MTSEGLGSITKGLKGDTTLNTKEPPMRRHMPAESEHNSSEKVNVNWAVVTHTVLSRDHLFASFKGVFLVQVMSNASRIDIL